VGKDLFWKFGFRRVTIEEICKEAGVSKMTYYKFFANKMDLVKILMDDILKTSLVKYRQIMDSDVSYPEKVIQMVELKRDQVKTMSNEFFRDYVQSADPEMINYLNQISQESMKMFVDDFSKAQKDGDLRKDVKIDFIMLMMNHMIEMTHDDHLLDLYDNPQDLVMEIINFLFYGILNRDVH
ncbi:MAG: TetR/AcrR family transcriptional regulator, partial [Bacteroidales bacterium]|nr:TetR/AcrR family transcriptional regulator [Bacteroidales bacterium]